MMQWFETLPGIEGTTALDETTLDTWPDRALDDRLCHLQFCPVVLAELYQIPQFYPLFVRDTPQGPMVMAELRTDQLRHPAFDAAGNFAWRYRPAVTRLLPFLSLSDGTPVRLKDAKEIRGPERPPEIRRQIVKMLALQGASHKRLQFAASFLISRGYLARHPSNPEDWTLSTNLPPQPPSDTPAAPEEFLALRLLAVLELSGRHRPDVVSAPRRTQSALPGLLSRDEALRQRNFLDQGELIDFSQLRIEIEDPKEQAGSDKEG